MSETSPQHRPTTLDLDLQAQVLRIGWADGQASTYRLALLRKYCPCATCRTERQQKANEPPAAKPLLPVLSPGQAAAASATVTGGQMVGNYAIQLQWSDGHNTGIYDFRLLRQMWDSGVAG